MLLYLFLLFTLLPLIELSILIWIGGQTTWWLPILLVIVTGLVGSALSRWQGWRVMQRIQEELRTGQMPADAMIDAVLIFIAGLMLVTPGVISDLAGLLLLLPPSRSVVKHAVASWIRRNFEIRSSASGAEFWQNGTAPQARSRDQIIDAKVIDTHVENVDVERHAAR